MDAEFAKPNLCALRALRVQFRKLNACDRVIRWPNSRQDYTKIAKEAKDPNPLFVTFAFLV